MARPPMRLTVLGSSASCPDAADACAGYLVQQGETSVLLDCGPGVIGNLRTVIDPAMLSAIVISHFHPDHYLDLVPLRYGLRYGLETPARPRLLVPPDGLGYLEGVGAAIRNAPAFFANAYLLEEYDPDIAVDIGEFTLSFRRTTHDIPTWACAVQGAGRLVYTSDTRESADLEAFAAGADLLLSESTYPRAFASRTDGAGNHLDSTQARDLARNAGVGALMLTHFWPGLDRTLFADEAERAFGAPVFLARPGLSVPIGRRGTIAGAIVEETVHA